jgi:formiminoglutamase
MSKDLPSFVTVERGDEPLLVSLPHTGTDIPPEIEARLASPWLARKDADWWIDRVYDFAGSLGATVVRTTMSRTVIDVNRDPSGASLYPGRATTDLCPLTTFDGEDLYLPGQAPDAQEVAERRERYFRPYHDALSAEVQRLRTRHRCVAVYDCHSIRSVVPRLFDGVLPNLNIGTNGGASCSPELSRIVERACEATRFSMVLNGRFKGGWITRHYGHPEHGVHAVQMELACRGYMDEPDVPTPENWPTAYDPNRAAPMRDALFTLLEAVLAFARQTSRTKA